MDHEGQVDRQAGRKEEREDVWKDARESRGRKTVKQSGKAKSNKT